MAEHADAVHDIPAPKRGYTLDDLLLFLPTNIAFYSHFSLGNTRCAEKEMQFLRCADVTGLRNSKFKCKEQLDSFIECKTRMTDVSRCSEVFFVFLIKYACTCLMFLKIKILTVS